MLLRPTNKLGENDKLHRERDISCEQPLSNPLLSLSSLCNYSFPISLSILSLISSCAPYTLFGSSLITPSLYLCVCLSCSLNLFAALSLAFFLQQRVSLTQSSYALILSLPPSFHPSLQALPFLLLSHAVSLSVQPSPSPLRPSALPSASFSLSCLLLTHPLLLSLSHTLLHLSSSSSLAYSFILVLPPNKWTI